MAKKRKRKRSRLKTLLFFILTPFVVWALGFLIWLYWHRITGTFGRRDNAVPVETGKKVERSTRPSDQSAQERIGEEDRRKLEEILKNKK